MAVDIESGKVNRELVTVPAVERALAILEQIADANEGLTLSELSKQLKLPKNAVFRITNTLRATGYLSRNERTMRFSLTPQLNRLTSGPADTRELIEVSFEVMRQLRNATGETVQIGRLVSHEGVILAHVESLHPLRIAVDDGLRFPLHNNAPGKLLLATLPESERTSLLDSLELKQFTDRTITRRADLEKECNRILTRGYSTDYAEADEGIHCVAAAIRDRRNATIGTIWISAPSRRLPKSDFASIGQAVIAAADAISRKLLEEG